MEMRESGGSSGNKQYAATRDSSAVPGLNPIRTTITTRADLMHLEFYQKPGWVEEAAEVLFKIRARGTSIRSECYFGLVHFISCIFVLAVIPQQLSNAGYDARATVVATAATCGLGCIICGIFANLPFVMAPPAVIGIFLTNNLQSNSLTPAIGSSAVLISGVVLTLLGYRPLAHLVSRLIPLPIQVGTVVGVGLLTAFTGATDVGLVVKGSSTHLLALGPISPEVMVAICGIVIITVATYYRIKGAFCIALVFCSFVWWTSSNSWPSALAATPRINPLTTFDNGSGPDEQGRVGFLTADLIFLFVLYLNGLVTSLSDLAGLTRAGDNSVPRGRWLYILCGTMTVIAGLFQAAPVLISPESSAAIKAGAKTGLSTVVCGLLFLVSVFFSPFFGSIPHAGASPVLIMIGVVLFQNVGRIDWRNVIDAAPTFIVLFFIPFTFSIIQGVLLGYAVLGLVWLFTGDLVENAVLLLLHYRPSLSGALGPDRLVLFGVRLRKGHPPSPLALADEHAGSVSVVGGFGGVGGVGGVGAGAAGGEGESSSSAGGGGDEERGRGGDGDRGDGGLAARLGARSPSPAPPSLPSPEPTANLFSPLPPPPRRVPSTPFGSTPSAAGVQGQAVGVSERADGALTFALGDARPPPPSSTTRDLIPPTPHSSARLGVSDMSRSSSLTTPAISPRAAELDGRRDRVFSDGDANPTPSTPLPRP